MDFTHLMYPLSADPLFSLVWVLVIAVLWLYISLILTENNLRHMRADQRLQRRDMDYDRGLDHVELAIMSYRFTYNEWPGSLHQLRASGLLTERMIPPETSMENWRLEWRPHNHHLRALVISYYSPPGSGHWPERMVVVEKK